ncbi:ankyrin repeat and SOCS box protein 2 isoform X2 [Kryptolebias marmoratus]|uniref:ankyrin repeat and SOCS box protein 2 isoform X2 n=1 Tax=Kryptolebias marmoratus TaxID=37003 RepID=UPI0007F8962D|nr:ankyrin repeat and SOCS box protein 2 isoform X2 [Kryptolebias marmoratus]
MATPGISHSSSAGSSLTFEDYSLYRNLNDDELLQLAIERSLIETHGGTATTTISTNSSTTITTKSTITQLPHRHDSNLNPSSTNRNKPQTSSTQNPAAVQTGAHYSSPNPPVEKPPDPKTFVGTMSRFMTGSGKRMVAYYKADGTLVHIAPEPEEDEEPLFRAIREGDSSRVKALAMCPGTNLMLPSKPGWLAVHQAAWFGQEACLRMLLIACERNNPAIVAALLNYGAEVNTSCTQGWTALQEAGGRNNVEICEMLLKAGAKHNVRNMYGIGPLFTAAQNGQLAALRLLIKHGADVNTQAADGATALYEAAKNGHEKVVELLLSQNADANKPGKTGLLPLHIAAQRGSDTIASMLIPVTSKARIRRTGISPLHLAAERNRDDTLELLINAGFDVNAQLSEERSRLYEDRRSTALYFSVINNNIDAVSMLLAAGANPNLDMFKPLLVAARINCIQTVQLLVEHGADINAGIPTHPTTFPAVYMFSMKYLPMFKYLLDHGGHALSCFDCMHGSQSHPPIKIRRSNWNHDSDRILPGMLQRTGVQFCEMISAPSISRWAGPIIDILLDYVGHVTLCSRLMEHLDSYSGWSIIKEKAALPRPLMHLCRLQILHLVGRRKLKKLPLPGSLIRFLKHQLSLDDN